MVFEMFYAEVLVLFLKLFFFVFWKSTVFLQHYLWYQSMFGVESWLKKKSRVKSNNLPKINKTYVEKAYLKQNKAKCYVHCLSELNCDVCLVSVVWSIYSSRHSTSWYKFVFDKLFNLKMVIFYYVSYRTCC